MRHSLLLAVTLTAISTTVLADNKLTVSLAMADEKGAGEVIGSIAITETPYGLLLTPDLSKLPAGVHGFHIHEKPSCDPAEKDGKAVAALAAGGHWDPEKTGRHTGPYGNGHKGDLPALYVQADGKANYPVLAPRLRKLDEIRGRALMVHAGGDNHDDHPAPLGGGGARMACGVIK
ncbi:superoxide dismutase family protein [Chitinivorax sp. B]|uniref:superoxide dismutase family protein n=1 Tax=Chitinivorax sp. B TaxID=2502235 RepID=UPI0010F7C7EB|nr:superoxide dismutase family protein [Chitinivorax sp. B]